MSTLQGYTVADPITAPNTSHGRGYESRDYSAYPTGGLKCARPFTAPLIDPAKIQSRIETKTQNKSWIKDICDNRGLKVKNQKSTSFCWINAPTHGMEVFYCLAGGFMPILSAAWSGSVIKNGRDVGGSGIEGVEFCSKSGSPTEAFWAQNRQSSQAKSDQAAVANAALHKIVAFDDLDASAHIQIITCIINDIPVTVGIPAWGHEILITFLVWQPGANLIHGFPNVGYGFDNSWGTEWGTNGRGILSASYSRFDEAGAIRDCTPCTA